jgi:hypothetical protein
MLLCLPVAPVAGGGSPFTSFSFSENGYHVAAVAPGSVSIWDLRKMKCYK